MDDIIGCVVEILNTENTADISNDLKDATNHKKDEESLFVFEDLDDVPESGKSEEGDCNNAES